MSEWIAQVVPDHDGQAVLFPAGQRLLACEAVSVERCGDALILRPARCTVRESEQDKRAATAES